jgi:glycosyltransferase involved in cell wall biosynthesis
LSVPSWRSLIRGRVAVVDHGVDPFFTHRNITRMRRRLDETAEAADVIVVVGQRLKAHALSLGLPEQKLHVVSNGTELPRRETVSFDQRPTHERRRIVSVSNLIPLKGIDDNLRALAAVFEKRPALKWEYRIVGDGSYRHELIKLASGLDLTNRVTFLGRLSYEATMREIAQADVFSLPSWAEAFGIVYLEAMARGRPAIGCVDNGAADIITDNEDGLLIMPRDVGALEAAIARLLESPELCSRLGVAGRRTAERFSWDENARRMLDLLDAGFVS